LEVLFYDWLIPLLWAYGNAAHHGRKPHLLLHAQEARERERQREKIKLP
jgi:hypothetical protein